MAKVRKLLANGEGKPVKSTLRKPCDDCPMRRDAVPGWLGGSKPEDYARLCHSDAVVMCHVHNNSRCAGMAIYRTNTCKSQPDEHKLPSDKVAVFSNMMEFLDHHKSPPFLKTFEKTP